MGLVLSLLILLTIVVIHEGGHFWAMRRNGVAIEEFSIGLGPLIWQRKDKRGTLWSLRWIPAGGYVKPSAIKTDASESETQIGLQGWELAASHWARFKIYMAGMFANATAAFIALTILFYATHRAPQVLIEWVQWAPSPLRPLACAFLASYVLWLATPVLFVVLIAKMGSAFFTGAAGPVGIITMGNQALAENPTLGAKVFGMVMFFAMINGAIAGFNMLPLFPLDGGRVAGILFEKLLGRNSTAEKYFRVATMLLIAAFFVFVILSDFIKLVPRPL